MAVTPEIKQTAQSLPQKQIHTQKSPDKRMLYGTIAILAIGFFVLVALAFVFSSVFELPGGKCIGVIEINQPITTESTPESIFAKGTPGSADFAKEIEKLEEKDNVAALLLVVNSPGGSVVATREIYLPLKNLSKPKVAYFREVAASGGYYIATATDYIVSDPDAITGSIGVVATFADMSGLLEKIGVNATAITSGKHKDIGSPTRPMDAEEEKIIKDIINEVFGEFKQTVLEGRKGKLDIEKFEGVLDGRMLSGRQAKEIGLVDSVGTKKDALRKAADLAGLKYEKGKEPTMCKIKVSPTESESLFGVDMLAQLFRMNSGDSGWKLKMQ